MLNSFSLLIFLFDVAAVCVRHIQRAPLFDHCTVERWTQHRLQSCRPLSFRFQFLFPILFRLVRYKYFRPIRNEHHIHRFTVFFFFLFFLPRSIASFMQSCIIICSIHVSFITIITTARITHVDFVHTTLHKPFAVNRFSPVFGKLKRLRCNYFI